MVLKNVNSKTKEYTITVAPSIEKYELPLHIIIEIMSIFEGIRPAMKIGSNSTLNELILNFVKANASDCDVRSIKHNNFYGRKGLAVNILYVAGKEITEKIIKADRVGNRILVGKYLGYPECCVKKFTEMIRSNKYTSRISEIYKTTKGSPSGLLNNIFSFESRLDLEKEPISISKLQNYRIISHIPCSYSCQKSIIMAKRIAGIYKKLVNAESWLFIKNLLFSTILYIDDFNFLIVKSIEKDTRKLKGRILMVSPWLIEKPFYDKLSVGQIIIYDFAKKELFAESSRKGKSVLMEIFSFE